MKANTTKKLLFGLLIVALVGLSGCTIIRYVDEDGGGNNGDGPPPKVVDMLVMVDLDRGTANLTADYGKILGTLMAGLESQRITVRKAAMAPLHRRSAGVVPLVYGENDADSEFSNFGQAIAFYTRDDGAEYLRDPASEGENLAALGLDLDTRAIYHPTTADPDARAYFTEPADGFVVITLSASERTCAHDSADCALDGSHPADYLTKSTGENASWLVLPGDSGVPTSKIFHGAIVTQEGVDYETFSQQCESQPNFPRTNLDVMEPSPVDYYGPLMEKIDESGGHAATVDLCEAMSSRGEIAVGELVARIRGMF